MREGRTEAASGTKTSSVAASKAPGRARLMTAKRKQEAVAREIGVTTAGLSYWRAIGSSTAARPA